MNGIYSRLNETIKFWIFHGLPCLFQEKIYREMIAVTTFIFPAHIRSEGVTLIFPFKLGEETSVEDICSGKTEFSGTVLKEISSE